MVATRKPQLVCVSRASWTLGSMRRLVPNKQALKTTSRTLLHPQHCSSECLPGHPPFSGKVRCFERKAILP